MENFFYRIDRLNLASGNKQSGFVLSASTSALKDLRTLSVPPEEAEIFIARTRAALVEGGMLSPHAARACTVEYVGQSVCPVSFSTGGPFAASLVGDADKIWRLEQDNALEMLGPEIRFVPHNTDRPQQALVLLVMAQQWTEWAAAKLFELHLQTTRVAGLQLAKVAIQELANNPANERLASFRRQTPG